MRLDAAPAVSNRKSLLLGCGSNSAKRITIPGLEGWGELVRLDNVESHKPDVLHDLRAPALPFETDSFDEIHAYEVLEHIGQQGDAELMLAQFADYWRVLKPNGYLCATCPSYRSMWAWGDPSHTRVITSGTLSFLNQRQYTEQVGKTAMSDFRHWYRADFEPAMVNETDERFEFVLQAIKPSRVTQ